MRMTSRHGLMTFLTFAALGLGVAVHAPAPAAANTPAWPAAVSYFESTPNGTVEKKGNLSAGKTMDLQWAAQSSVACFPATEYDNFRGNHVLYATQIPKYSEMVITVTPDDPKTDVSLYAYEISTTDTTHVAPNLPSCVACEAGYDQVHDSNPGKPEKVKLVATNHPYNVVIGVAGAKGMLTGGYTLKIELKTKVEGPPSADVPPIALESKPNATVETTGKLESGGKFDLSFAANSSNACWPATENVNFNGNHVLYRTYIPPYSQMFIEAKPTDPKTDVSVYAMMISATDTKHYPPNMPSCVTCEAGYDQKKDSNPGVTEAIKLNSTTHGYNVIIGVAGAQGTSAGAYSLKVKLVTKEAGPPSQDVPPIVIASKPGAVVETTGKLESGGKFDLSFASYSSNACWPATENVNFNGNHVLYRTTIPPQSEMIVTAEPQDAKTDVSVYAMMIGATDTTHYPPNVPSCVSCEAGYDQKKDSNPGVAEKAKLQATTHGYNVIIGVAGANGTTAGNYKLKIDVHGR